MPSADKAEVKVGMGQQVRERLLAKADGMERNALAMKAAADILKREFEHHKSIKDYLRKSLDDGDINQKEFDAGMQVLQSCVTINQKLTNTNAVEAERQRFAAAGVRMSVEIVDEEIRRAEAQKRQALADAEEEEKRLAEEAAFQAGEDLEEDTPPGQEDGQEEAQHPGEEAETPTSESLEEDTSLDTEEDTAACSHCGQPLVMSTGSSVCVQCTSYKNRYDKLPPPHILEKWEQKRQEE